jgi:hypothetical protein
MHLQPYGNTIAFIPVVNLFGRNLCLYITEALFLLYGVFSIKKYNYDNDAGFSVFIISSLLLSPLCWSHYLTLLLLPLVFLIKELLKKNTISEIVLFLTALFLLSVDTDSFYFKEAVQIAQWWTHGNSLSLAFRLTFYDAQFYGMVLLLFLNFRMIRKTATASVDNSI